MRRADFGVVEMMPLVRTGVEGGAVGAFAVGVGDVTVVLGGLGVPPVAVDGAEEGIPDAVHAVVAGVVVLLVDEGDAVRVGGVGADENADGEAELGLDGDLPGDGVEAGAGVGGYGVEVVAGAGDGVGDEVGEGVDGGAV